MASKEVNGAVNGTKRKSTAAAAAAAAANDSSSSSPIANKKARTRDAESRFGDRSRYMDSSQAEEQEIVMRKYYPPEMSDERARRYARGEIERPIETLARAMAETEAARDKMSLTGAVVHWFKCDLRTGDNKGLHMASQMARSKAQAKVKDGVPLIGVYLVSPQDFEAHLTSPIRVDFILRTLHVLRADLAALDVPLYVEVVEQRKRLPNRLMELCAEWNASHVFCNVEYEVDELRREAALTRDCLKRDIAFTAVHDTCVVPPGQLSSKGTGGQFSVFSPWFRAWCAHLNSHQTELDGFPVPAKNPSGARERFKDLFGCDVPPAPANKQLTDEERKRFKTMWPAGEHEAAHRLEKFIDQRIRKYGERRNYPAANSTSVVSVHLASGTLAARTCVRRARDANSSKSLDAGDAGVQAWISEVAWRDFYKHVLAHWPYVCMNKPFKPPTSHIRWEPDSSSSSSSSSSFQAWTQGRTGYPIVDAAMRQLLHTGYMHNRCRMIVASFLSKHLLIDWRRGERHFMLHLIDGDFASNNGGWGFGASVGVDPQPYFRVFNPTLQGRRFDAEGEYVRKWVGELNGVQGDVHEPYALPDGGKGKGKGKGKGQGKGGDGVCEDVDGAALAERNGYPRPIVEHRFARERALARYKEALGRDQIN